MIRYQIFENDVTTAGGVVQKHTEGASTFIWHNRLASNIGDKINCSACGSVGYIQTAGMRRPFYNMNHVPALNDDLCICKCDPPPKLKNSQTTCNQNVEGGIVWDNSKTTINKTINSYFPNSQQSLNNSLVEIRTSLITNGIGGLYCLKTLKLLLKKKIVFKKILVTYMMNMLLAKYIKFMKLILKRGMVKWHLRNSYHVSKTVLIHLVLHLGAH